MPGDTVSQFLKAKGILRSHPDWTDEQVAEAAGIHKLDIDRTVAVARRELETAEEWHKR